MKVDPNIAVNMRAEHIMCQIGGVELYDSTVVTVAHLTTPGGPFETFCKTLDPNAGYIAAFVPDHRADDVFYAAREAARAYGIHMQSTIERPERQLENWRTYQQIKRRQVTA